METNLKCVYCEDQTPYVTMYEDDDGHPICEDCLAEDSFDLTMYELNLKWQEGKHVNRKGMEMSFDEVSDEHLQNIIDCFKARVSVEPLIREQERRSLKSLESRVDALTDEINSLQDSSDNND